MILQKRETGIGLILLLISISLAVSYTCLSQIAGGNRVGVGFYNCENFFDTTDNPAKADDDFTPRGKYHYTRKIYEQKLHNIAAVLQSMHPALMGIAEVENDKVLEALSRQPAIAARKYRYVWYDGPDPRGINVALVYDPTLFSVIKSEPVHVNISGTAGKAVTRDALYVHGVLAGDTVHVFVNHWPSRRGGEEASASKRTIAAKVNRDACAELFRENRNARIIIMGDLNDNPDDKSVANVLGATHDAGAVTATGFFNPFFDLYKAGKGTEVYRHKWNLFDQVIISGAALHSKNLDYTGSEIYSPGFLKDKYKGHEGEPYRSFVGTRWIGGYSDHFPVVVYFRRK